MPPIHSGGNHRSGVPFDQLERGPSPQGPRAPTSSTSPAKTKSAQAREGAQRKALDGLEQQARAARTIEAAQTHAATQLPAPAARPVGGRAMPRRGSSDKTASPIAAAPSRPYRAFVAASPAQKRDAEEDTPTSTKGLKRRRTPPAVPARRRLASAPLAQRPQTQALPPAPGRVRDANSSKLPSPVPSSASSVGTSSPSSRSNSTAPTTPASSPPPSSSERAVESRALAAIAGHKHYASFVSYLSAMKKPHTYGTEVELEALSRMLNRPIHVYKTERFVKTAADGTRSWHEQMAALSEWTVGAHLTGNPPITLRHTTSLDANGRGADSNGNHYDMVANLAPEQGRHVSLSTLNAHTQKSIGDGACLFRSVSAFLEMEQEAKGGAIKLNAERKESGSHLALRKDVVMWERDNALTQLSNGLQFIDFASLT